MAYRNELAAAQAHVESLQRENSTLQERNQSLQVRQPHFNDLPARRDQLRDRLAVGSGTLMTCALVSIMVTSSGFALSLAALACWGLGMMGAGRALGVTAGPGEVLVLSGRAHMTPEGPVGFRIVPFGERVWRVPLMERVDRLDIRPFPLKVEVRAAYSSDSIPVDVTAHVVVRIDPTSPRVNRAVERFLGQAMQEVHKMANDVVGGELHAIVALMTADELRSQQIILAEKLVVIADETLGKLGLRVETSVITKVSSPVWHKPKRSGSH